MSGAGSPAGGVKLPTPAGLMKREDLEVEVETLRREANSLRGEVSRLKRTASAMVTGVEIGQEALTNKLMKSLEAEKAAYASQAGRGKQLERQLLEMRKASISSEQRREAEQEFLVNKLQREIQQVHLEKRLLEERLEQESRRAGATPTRERQLREKLRKAEESKINLENQLEAEQEFIVNKLSKRLEMATKENRTLHRRLSMDSDALASELTSRVGSLEEAATKKEEVSAIRTDLEVLVHKYNECKTELVTTKAEASKLAQENFLLKQKLEALQAEVNQQKTQASRMANTLEVDSERQFNALTRSSDSESEPMTRARAGSVENAAAFSVRTMRRASGCELAGMLTATTPRSVGSSLASARSPSPAMAVDPMALAALQHTSSRQSFHALFDDLNDDDEFAFTSRTPTAAQSPHVGPAPVGMAPAVGIAPVSVGHVPTNISPRR